MWYHYLWWIPAVFVYYGIYYWLSVKVNEQSQLLPDRPWHHDPWFVGMLVYGALCPFWLIVSRISQRIFLDGIIYDQVMLLSYYAWMIGLGQAVRFGWWQWLGVAFLFAGSFLIRIGPQN